MSQTHNFACLSSEDCLYLYECVDQICKHKDLWPPQLIEIVGLIIICGFSGFASLAGVGGGGIMVSILTTFLNYSQKEAVLFVFIPVFGAALGNFLNLVKQVDPIKQTPIVNIRAAIMACPVMIIGSIIGFMINKFLSSFFIVLFLECFITKAIFKFYATAMNETRIENERRRVASSAQELELQLVEVTQDIQQSNDEQPKQYEYHQDVAIVALIIVGTVIFGFLLRGSQEFQSIIGIPYCGSLYWVITIGILGILYKYFQLTCDRFLALAQQSQKAQYMAMSFKAGIINGFGLGGGMFLIPLYLSFGYSSIQSTGTSSFNILISSFVAASQTVILGFCTLNQAIWIGGLTTIGCYFSSTFIFTQLNKRDRLSIIMWSLVFFAGYAMITLAMKFMTNWSQSGYDIAELFRFQGFC